VATGHLDPNDITHKQPRVADHYRFGYHWYSPMSLRRTGRRHRALCRRNPDCRVYQCELTKSRPLCGFRLHRMTGNDIQNVNGDHWRS
jgi:hypothetical protein